MKKLIRTVLFIIGILPYVIYAYMALSYPGGGSGAGEGEGLLFIIIALAVFVILGFIFAIYLAILIFFPKYSNSLKINSENKSETFLNIGIFFYTGLTAFPFFLLALSNIKSSQILIAIPFLLLNFMISIYCILQFFGSKQAIFWIDKLSRK